MESALIVAIIAAGTSIVSIVATLFVAKKSRDSGWNAGGFCTRVNETNWYERSLGWHEGRSIQRSRS